VHPAVVAAAARRHHHHAVCVHVDCGRDVRCDGDRDRRDAVPDRAAVDHRPVRLTAGCTAAAVVVIAELMCRRCYPIHCRRCRSGRSWVRGSPAPVSMARWEPQALSCRRGRLVAAPHREEQSWLNPLCRGTDRYRRTIRRRDCFVDARTDEACGRDEKDVGVHS